ncbi:Spore coat associated protein JA (CotJA) [Pelotomaculum schinkii]|uniref:Spore coat associated protein JA (CotJA) n=1 Tax=Pelotomaculum schinkii TaxID=78350 RepID=A0A4Y7RHU5_9FIRM|nr:spore coat associated protein CotJA [Pelotomaculum schinkii]TEB08386.1 Spore coat associated protein JA (CotJA) [Pelotomaculum schinkii]
MLPQNPQRPPASPAPAVKGKDKAEAPFEVKSQTAEDLQAEGLYPTARLAQAYVIWQKYGRTFTPAEALEKGTLFPDLYRPYPY